MDKKISVIIPCYNVAKWLPKCFISLTEQSIGIENLELIFINDASTDDGATWNMLTEMERAYPQSIIIIDLPENRRQGGARNEGLKYASGEYISFVDADDWIETDLYEKAYYRAQQTHADIVQFNHSFYFEKAGIVPNTTEMLDECIRIESDEDRRRMLISEKLTYGCWNKIYKRELVERAGVHYAEHVMYEEPLFVYPLLFYGTCYVTMPDRLYIYRQNQLGTMRKDMEAKQTLLQHAQVQLDVWNFMKQTEFFQPFYEEIKMYFLHTYLYEILDFAGRRGLDLELEEFLPLAKRAVMEAEDITQSPYERILPKQMRLYRLIKNGLTEEDFREYKKQIQN
jgi:glycosyltransferase involved in cell wall biosynthesis